MWVTVFSAKMPERKIEWVNDSIRLIGYEPSECVGKDTAFLYSDKDNFLEKYKKHLETIVKEQTNKLEEQVEELERMNDLFVGREFRIKELRDKIKKLEKIKD